MAKCDGCNGIVDFNNGDVTCTDCSVPLHNNCANWIEGCTSFCNHCYNNIVYNQECSECNNNSLTEFSSGSYCYKCDWWKWD